MTLSVEPDAVDRRRTAVFYKVYASRVTLREFWWETKLLIWVALIIKLFRLNPRGSTDDLAVDSLRPFRVDESRIAPDALSRFAPTLETLRRLGFGDIIWFDQDDPFQATHNTVAVVLHSSGRAWARVQQRANFGRVPAKVKFFTTFVSPTTGGYIVTGNGRHDMAWPDTHDTVRLRGTAVDEVWALHQNRLTAAVQTVSPADLEAAVEAHHVSLRDFHLGRGVFQPLGDEEFLLSPFAHSPAPATPPAIEGDTDHPAPAAQPDLMEVATLTELQRLQTKKANWRFSLVLLALSALLFVYFARRGDAEQGWEYVGIIVGVLLVHELGHYLAMKLFGYRNLRMFFIPGFGAAVSGRHYNAPAWKKIVVSLMGPIPGVLIGTGLVVASYLHGNDLCYRIGIMALILNGFNLLPVLPLDGGWVAHAALFARHPTLDIGFRLVTAVAMIGLGFIVPGARVLVILGIVSLIALPAAGKLARIVKELRALPDLGVSPDDQSIPTETARVILARVRERFKMNLNPKLAAQHVASVFESLNARPPSVGATLGLLTVHVAGFGLAFVASVAALALNYRGLSPDTPQYAVSAGQIETRGTQLTPNQNLVIARFKSNDDAVAALVALPSDRRVSRFGQTLLVGFSSADTPAQRELFDAYEKRAEDVFVSNQQMRAYVELRFKWPDTPAARQTFDDLAAYLQLSDWALTPPWASEADWPPARREVDTPLRRLVTELQKRPDLESSIDSWKQVNAAQRRGDAAEAERLEAEQQQKAEDIQRQGDARLEKQFGHADLIRQWADIRSVKDFSRKEERYKNEIAPRLGQWPRDKPDDLLVNGGHAIAVPELDHIVGCQLAKADTGLLALTRWLIAEGATDIRYHITSLTISELDELD
ncbi:MAG TPA: site-2 protease family protein [Tepidisphaeraceae bacterium]|jgi:Zn-dependent protease